MPDFDVQEQMAKLDNYRKQAEGLSAEKIRLETELKSYRSQLNDLQQKSKEKFGCKVQELPKLEQELIEGAEEMMSEINKLLGEDEPAQEDDFSMAMD